METIRRPMLFALVTALATMLPVAAQGPSEETPPPPPDGPGGMPNPVIGMAGWALHQLDLDSDQQQQIRDLVRTCLEGECGERLRTLDESRRALELLVWGPEATEQEILDASAIVAEAAAQFELARRQVTLGILEVLTEEQRVEFQELLQMEPPRPGGPGGRGGDGGPGGRRGPGPRDR